MVLPVSLPTIPSDRAPGGGGLGFTPVDCGQALPAHATGPIRKSQATDNGTAYLDCGLKVAGVSGTTVLVSNPTGADVDGATLYLSY